MSPAEVLQYTASVALLIIAFSLAYVAYHLVQALKPMKKILNEVEDTTKDVQIIKDSVKLGLTGILGKFVKNSKKEGGEHGK